MGVYVYSVSRTQTKTNLGFNFHLSQFCYKLGCHVDPWTDKPTKWLQLTQGRLDATQSVFDYNPSKWSGYIGSISRNPNRGSDKKIVIGTEVWIYKLDRGISEYYDTDEPGPYMITIKKTGRGIWEPIIDDQRNQTEIPNLILAPAST